MAIRIGTTNQRSTELTLEEKLWYEVINQAVKDGQRVKWPYDPGTKRKIQSDAINFLYNPRNPSLDYICSALGCNTEAIKEQIERKLSGAA